MPLSSEAERWSLAANPYLKAFSCLRCRQRKVKCNRLDPCSNCTKTSSQCSFVAPVRGKPKRRIAPKEGLHAKLRRYEDMLRSYGARIENSENGKSASDVETVSEPDIEMAESVDFNAENAESRKGRSRTSTIKETRTKLISGNGSSRYFDNGRWTNLGDEFLIPEREGQSKSLDGLDLHASDLFVDAAEEGGLVLSTFSKSEELANLHFPSHILQKMLDIYTERIDPLMKVLHLPTFWSTLTNGLQYPNDMSKSLEAVIFAFYVAVIVSLKDNECYSLLGEQQSIISARYISAARQALISAGFIRTTSLMTLQAYVIFLISLRGHYQNDTLFVLSGIAVRLGRKMGLHRDGTLLGLSPFETELRRRLWWHIVIIDCHTADFAGTKPSMDLFLSDTKVPLNVEDEDLRPDMIDPPPERSGITSVVLCLIRYDVMEFLRKVTSQSSSDVRWDNLTNFGITLAEKDNMINQIEDMFERKYLRYYDPTNSLHVFASVVARSSISKMKLFAHNPRQFANCGVKVPQKSRDIVFANGIKMLEYASLMFNNESLRKFTWLFSTRYLGDPLLYVLTETRNRKTGPEVDRAWQRIGEVSTHYPQVFTETTGALYAAIGSWTLQVWDECAAARKAQGLPEIPAPDFISAIRRSRAPSAIPSSKLDSSVDPERALESSTVYDESDSLGHAANSMTDFEPVDSYDFSNLLSFDLEPSDWAQWERLLAGQDG